MRRSRTRTSRPRSRATGPNSTRLESAKLVTDAVTSIELATSFIEGKSLADFTNDALLRSAVEPQLEIVGEAIAVLRRNDPDVAARIPYASEAIGLRNVLVHGYSVINRATVWHTVSNDLPPLLTVLRALLNPTDEAALTLTLSLRSTRWATLQNRS